MKHRASQLKAIAAAELTKEFDNVNHDAILQELALTNCGTVIYKYPANSYKREHAIKIGDHQFEEIAASTKASLREQ